jgi:glycosyltransferase involved in cell wall biosynthesis
MGAAARRRVEEKYGWLGVAQAYLDLMRKIVEKK